MFDLFFPSIIAFKFFVNKLFVSYSETMLLLNVGLKFIFRHGIVLAAKGNAWVSHFDLNQVQSNLINA